MHVLPGLVVGTRWLPEIAGWSIAPSRPRFQSSAFSSKQPWTNLLVDADIFSTEIIERAIHALDGRVTAHIFAEPRRSQSKKWQELLSREDVNFRPIDRTSIHGQPNDLAIMNFVEFSGKVSDGSNIALLTADKKLAKDVAACARRHGIQLSVFVESKQKATISTKVLEELCATVVCLERLHETSSKVQAYLHQDGKGSVSLQDTPLMLDDEFQSQAALLQEFLCNLGFLRSEEDAILLGLVKCYFEHADILRSAVDISQHPVFPLSLAVESFFKLVHHGTAKLWKARQGSHAFCLPVAGGNANKASVRKTYGRRRSVASTWEVVLSSCQTQTTWFCRC